MAKTAKKKTVSLQLAISPELHAKMKAIADEEGKKFRPFVVEKIRWLFEDSGLLRRDVAAGIAPPL